MCVPLASELGRLVLFLLLQRTKKPGLIKMLSLVEAGDAFLWHTVGSCDTDVTSPRKDSIVFRYHHRCLSCPGWRVWVALFGSERSWGSFDIIREFLPALLLSQLRWQGEAHSGDSSAMGTWWILWSLQTDNCVSGWLSHQQVTFGQVLVG